jgi:hypothetical protein
LRVVAEVMKPKAGDLEVGHETCERAREHLEVALREHSYLGA